MRPDEFVRYGRHTCWVGADGKASIERLCISLPYVETFNLKVIKGFVPELRSRYVFFVFRDSYVLCIYVMNILCTFHTYLCMAMLHRDHSKYNIVMIVQKTEKSPGDVRRLAVTQIPVRKHQLTLVWKIRKGVNNNNNNNSNKQIT